MSKHKEAAAKMAEALETLAASMRELVESVDMEPEFKSKALQEEGFENRVGRYALCTLGNWLNDLGLKAVLDGDAAERLEWTATSMRAVAEMLPREEEQK